MKLGWWTVALLISAVIAVPAFLVFAGSDEDEAQTADRQDVTISEISNHRGKYLDETVTVRAEIQKIFHPKLLVIGPDGDSSKRVVVRTSKPLQAADSRRTPRAGQTIEVTGEVDAVDLEELRRSGEPLTDGPGPDLADRALIRATRFELTPGMPSAGDAAETEPSEVLANPGRYRGELTTVSGKAGRVYSPNAFSIAGLLVVTTLNSGADVFEGDELEVTGPVRRLDLERIRREQRDLALPRELSRLEGEPVLVARVVNRAGRPPHPRTGVDPRSLD